MAKFWVFFLIEAFMRFSVAGLMLTMGEFSKIIFGVDEFQPVEMGYIISSKLLLLAFTGIIFGILADRYSRKWLLVIAFLIMGAAKILNGFAFVPLMFPLFLLCYSLLGTGQGAVAPVVISHINDSCSRLSRSRFFGLLEAIRQSSLIGGMITSAILVQLGFWRLYFWLTGSMLLSCSLIVALFLKGPKRGMESHDSMRSILSEASVHYNYVLSKDTIRSTIFSKTNIIAFIEGIGTWILFSIAIYLIYPYIQNDPHNISPVSSSILMIIFGLPGALAGSIGFSKLSDKLATKSIKSRVYLIIFSMLSLFVIVIVMFLLPLPLLSPSEGTDLSLMFNYPVFIVFGVLIFFLRGVLGIYHINQTPILQAINLPEAQGMISSWNQFLESAGFGLGPLISGYLLALSNDNYTFTAIIAMMIGIPSICMWFLANKWIKADVNRVQQILKHRAGELSDNKK